MVINVCCSFCLFLRSFFLHRQRSPESFSVTRRCCCMWSFQHRTFESSAWTQILLTAWNWCWKTNCSYALHLTFNMKMRISKTSVTSFVLTIYQRTRWHCILFSSFIISDDILFIEQPNRVLYRSAFTAMASSFSHSHLLIWCRAEAQAGQWCF